MAKDSIYLAAMPLIDKNDTEVTFGGDSEMRWGEPDNRPIAPTQFTTDRRYWELLGEPDHIVIAITTEAGWDTLVPANASMTFDAAKIDGALEG